VTIRLLTAPEWDVLRDVRLAALYESPDSFLSLYQEERQYGSRWWKAAVRRDTWMVCTSDEGATQALLGATRAIDIPPSDRYLSYLWVAPSARGRGIGTRLVTQMLTHLRDGGVPRVWLWVFDGNEAAHRLYRKIGFQSTGVRKQLEQDPFRAEERLLLDLL
jgi:ribosomal protein S18 acetylase RimI-like enzyme